MSAQEYYERLGVDLSKLSYFVSDAIASQFLEGIYLAKEEIEYIDYNQEEELNDIQE